MVHFGFYLAPRAGDGEGKGNPMGLNPQTDVWLDANVLVNTSTTLEQFVQSIIDGSDDKSAKAQPIILDGVKGYKVVLDTPQGLQGTYSYQVATVKNMNVYRINLFAFKKDILLLNEQLFDQILSTFRFTN